MAAVLASGRKACSRRADERAARTPLGARARARLRLRRLPCRRAAPRLASTSAWPAAIVIYAIAATSLNLVLGYAGLVSFGHAAFVGLGAYVTGILVSEGVVGGGSHLLARSLASRRSPRSLIGAISLRTRGVYFIMITLAFAQMLFYLANSVKGYGGDEGLNIRARSALGFGARPEESLALYYVALAVLALRFSAGALRPVALRPRGAGACATTTCAPRRSAFRPIAEARRLRGRRRARRHRRRADREPAGLRQPERAALDPVGHADGDGDPRRRRHGLGRPRSAPPRCCCCRRCCRRTPSTGSSGPAGCCSRWCCSRARAWSAARRRVGCRSGMSRRPRPASPAARRPRPQKRFGGVVATDRVDLRGRAPAKCMR